MVDLEDLILELNYVNILIGGVIIEVSINEITKHKKEGVYESVDLENGFEDSHKVFSEELSFVISWNRKEEVNDFITVSIYLKIN